MAAPKHYVRCQQCDAEHEAEYSHNSPFGGHPVYAVVCTVDYLTDYYTPEVVYAR